MARSRMYADVFKSRYDERWKGMQWDVTLHVSERYLVTSVTVWCVYTSPEGYKMRCDITQPAEMFVDLFEQIEYLFTETALGCSEQLRFPI